MQILQSEECQEKCSVCGIKYSGLSREHLRTDQHQLFKKLFNSLRELPMPEVAFLSRKYVIGDVKELPKEKTKEVKKKVVDSDSEEEIKPKKKVAFKATKKQLKD